MPQKRFTRIIALAAVIVTGCWFTAPSAIGGDEAITVPAEPTVVTFVDPTQVSGLSTETISGGPGRPHVYAGYPTLTYAPALNTRLHQEMTAAIRRFTSRKPERDPRSAPEFNSEWQITAASGDVAGVRLRTAEFSGANWRVSFRTLWYDRTRRKVLESHELIAKLDVLASLVRERLEGGSTVHTDEITASPKLFDSIDFNQNGDLVVEFDDYAVAAGSIGRVAVAVPRREADPLLSAFGREVRDTVDAATPASMVNALPAPQIPNVTAGVLHGPVDCAVAKCVALTFNDGPGPYTGRLLDILAAKEARATFYTVGSNAEARPDLLRRMRDEGHLIANHTWSHRDLTLLPESKIYAQISRTQSVIGSATGQVPSLMRAPYGERDPRVAEVAKELGLSIVQWNVDTRDAKDPNPHTIARHAIDGAARGAILLMHDVHRESVNAVPEVLKELIRRGYVFVTVPELYGSRPMEPGKSYHAGAAAAAGHPGQAPR